MAKTKLLLTIVLIISCVFVKAQSYKTALGVRLGGLSNGITLKHFISPNSALEGIASIGNRTFIVTGLYELHSSVDNSKLFKFYYGAGAHIGFFQDGGYYNYYNSYYYTNQTVIGIDGIIGLGYKFYSAPINIGMDFKPFMDLNNGSNFYFDGAISIRYTF
jgi:hypothetical protein